jgi:hypothetical protein
VVLDDLASSLPSYPQEVLLVKGLLRFEIEYTKTGLTNPCFFDIFFNRPKTQNTGALF